MDGTSRPLAALLLVSLSGTACSFSKSAESTSAELAEQPAVQSAVDEQQPSLDVQFAMARTFEQERDLDRAARLYRAILAQDSRHAGATHRLAIVCDQQGNHKESRRLFQRALGLRPGNADVYCDFGYSLYCQQQWVQAERNFRLALDADRGHKRAHHHLGLTLAAQGNDTVALREFRKSGCSTGEARANLALMQTFTGRLEEAASNCELARKADPANEQVVSQLNQIEAVLAKATPQTEAAGEVMVAQKGRVVQVDGAQQEQPEPTPVWAVGFGSQPARHPTPAAGTTRTPSQKSAQKPRQEPKQATNDAHEQVNASPEEEPSTSPWRRLLKWRRADDAGAK